MQYSDFENSLRKVGLELMFLTPEKYESPFGITAVELSKRVELPVDVVKKMLVVLKDKEIVKSKGFNPKFWLFDEYNFQRMDEDDDVYVLLSSFDDVDFDRFSAY